MTDKPWNEKVPSKGKSMSPAQVRSAKARAKAAGRPYPNLVDNMAAMKEDAEAHSSDPRKPSSRFDASDELVKVYKDSTPGQSKNPSKTLKTLRKVVREALGDCGCGGSCKCGDTKKIDESYFSLEKAVAAAKGQGAPIEIWSHEGKFYLNAVKYKKEHNALKKFGAKLVKVVEETELDEAEYQGREVPLGKVMKGDVKKSKVYVRNSKGNVVKVNFGDKKLSIKKHIPGRKKNYCARSSGQGNLTDRTKANYWSRRAWDC